MLVLTALSLLVSIIALSQDECVPASAPLSPITHQYATENLPVSRVSFSSCHVPEDMHTAPSFWSDVRHVSRPDLWLWLGDNMYRDGNDINAKVAS